METDSDSSNFEIKNRDFKIRIVEKNKIKDSIDNYLLEEEEIQSKKLSKVELLDDYAVAELEDRQLQNLSEELIERVAGQLFEIGLFFIDHIDAIITISSQKRNREKI